MKKALLALVFINAVFFGYVRLIANPEPLPPAPTKPIPRLVLVGESAPAGPTQAKTEQPPDQSRCVSIGPVGDRAVADALKEWLAVRYTPRERVVDSAGPTTYWVSLASKTMQEAARIAVRLRAAGVKDLEVLPPEGDRTAPTLSLGLFTDRARAERRVSDLRRFAVNPLIVEQSQSASAFWFDIDLAGTEPPPEAAAVTAAVTGSAGLHVGACPSAATPVTTPGNRVPSTPNNAAPSVPPNAKMSGAPA